MMSLASTYARRVFRASPVTRGPVRDRSQLASQLCTAEQLASPRFAGWLAAMREPAQFHRKLWEWAFIAQALDERQMLRPGRSGLGFAVGTEPLAALLASRGCAVLATDLDPGLADAEQSRWITSGQHATDYGYLNTRGICPAAAFRKLVRLRYVDMNRIPDDLGEYDFLWSSCSFEHLGTLERGKVFVEKSLRHLKPGGVAVHTTEFNVLSDSATIEVGPDVIYRRRDIEELAERVAALGGRMVKRDYNAGDTARDWQIDAPPYFQSGAHLKLKYLDHTITSIGLIIEKA